MKFPRCFLAVALIALSASASWAGEICLHAAQSEPGDFATGACTYVVTTTSTGPSVVARCGTGTTTVGMYWNLTLPPDVPDAMVFTDFTVHWLKGLATTGNGCWSFYAQVFKDGQDFTDATFPTAWALEGDAIPTGTNIKKSTTDSAAAGTIVDAAGTACSTDAGGCRLSPLRIRTFRVNGAGCSGNADNAIDLEKFCLTY